MNASILKDRAGQFRPWLAWACISAASLALIPVGLPLIRSEQVGNDFLEFWTAGTLLFHGESPYQADGQARIQKELGWDREKNGLGIYDFLPYYYPPWLALAFVPLLPLGYGIAKPVWCFLNLELAVAAGFLLGCPRSGPPRGMAVVLTLTFFPTVACLLSAQTSVLILLLAVAVWRLSERGWDGAAGIALACLTVKPQLSVVAVFAILVWAVRQRRWRLPGAFLMTCLGLVAASQAVAPTWLGDMLAAPRLTPPPTDYFPWIGNTWLLVLKSLGLSGPLLWSAYLLLAVPFLVAVARSAFSPLSRLEDLLSLGILAAFFVAPYARHYDFAVLLIPLVVVRARLPRPAGFALVALLAFAPYVQLFVLVHYKEQQPPSVKSLVECTYFWVPLVLAAGWLISGLVKKRVT
jgi:Glycosyltransferase family 87